MKRTCKMCKCIFQAPNMRGAFCPPCKKKNKKKNDKNWVISHRDHLNEYQREWRKRKKLDAQALLENGGIVAKKSKATISTAVKVKTTKPKVSAAKVVPAAKSKVSKAKVARK